MQSKIISSAILAGLVGTLIVEGFPLKLEALYSREVGLNDFILAWIGWSIFSGIILYFAKKS